MKFDIYKQPFRLLLPDETNEYRTFTGGTISLLTISVLLTFALIKFTILLQASEYKVQMRDEDGYYEDTDRFGAENEFMIGAAITGFYEPLFHIPEEIGYLKFYRKYWA